ncbi:hypothetical protein [Streptomyces sp. NPDC002845]
MPQATQTPAARSGSLSDIGLIRSAPWPCTAGTGRAETPGCARARRPTGECARRPACSSIAVHLVGGTTVRSTSGLTTGNLGFEEVRSRAPALVGDTLYAATEITGRRLSKSRPDTGVVTCRTTGHNQDGNTVITFTRSFFVPADADTVRDHTNY